MLRYGTFNSSLGITLLMQGDSLKAFVGVLVCASACVGVRVCASACVAVCVRVWLALLSTAVEI